LKSETAVINWNYVQNASAVFFENRYLIALPTTHNYNDTVWVYYPATGGWSVWTGWNVAEWAKVRIDGKENLYYIDSVNGNVVQALVEEVFTDLGLTINYSEEGRKEDVGIPMVSKSSGEIYVKFLGVSDTTAKVYAEFDDGGYNLLGSVTISGAGVTFPVTFPVEFSDAKTVTAKFPIDQYGEWKTVRIKVERTTTGDDTQIVVLERGVVTYSDQYIPEE
jgi:hypothetical protein